MRKLIITKDFQKQIDMFHEIVGATEWSGVLFYTLTPNFADIDCVIIPKYIFPMDVGTTAATNFDYSEELLDAYDKLPGAEDCKEGIIHTHHSMSSFYSKTDEDELLENAKNYDFYLSIVLSFKHDYKARIAIQPTSVKLVVDRNGHRFELDEYTSKPIFMDIPVEYEVASINEEDDMVIRMRELIQKNADKAKAKSTTPASITKYGNYGYEDYKNDRSSFQKAGYTTNKHDKKKKYYGDKQYEFLSKWISQDPKSTEILYRVLIDASKEYNQYKDPVDRMDALDTLEGILIDSFDDYFVGVYGTVMEEYIATNYAYGTKIDVLLNKYAETFAQMKQDKSIEEIVTIVANAIRRIALSVKTMMLEE